MFLRKEKQDHLILPIRLSNTIKYSHTQTDASVEPSPLGNSINKIK